MMKRISFLIIGAGPYGLATAAYAKRLGLDFLVLGIPMEFWFTHMPKGMFLRSGSDWHLDAQEIFTFEAFLQTRNLKSSDVYPLPVNLFREYGLWFADRADLPVKPSMVQEIQYREDGFIATLEDGNNILAENVLLTPGFRYFMNIPEDLTEIIPPGRYAHTCELVEFESLRGKQCLIIGGRQSAFEWAALISEMKAEKIYLAYRHDTPRFEASDWQWINPMMDLTSNIRGWYRRLPTDERKAIEQRFWAEGRLKLEPWLASRVSKNCIRLMPKCNLKECREEDGDQVLVRLNNGQVFLVDQIILATGYRVNILGIPYLSHESIVSNLQTKEGFPVLDEDFQTSLSGLFITGLPATRDFGPFFGFVKGCPTAAKIIVNRILDRYKG